MTTVEEVKKLEPVLTKKLVKRCQLYDLPITPFEYRNSVNELLAITDTLASDLRKQVETYKEAYETQDRYIKLLESKCGIEPPRDKK